MTVQRSLQRQATKSLAECYQREHGDKALRLALEVANEVIGFDAHRMYLRFRDGSELTWTYQGGYHAGTEMDKGLESCGDLEQRLLQTGRSFHQFERSRDHWVALARLCGPEEMRGYIAVHRAPGRFTRCEARHLLMVARLLQGALTLDEHFRLLQRLHLAFLDGRILLRTAPLDVINKALLHKALYVLHDFTCEPMGDEQETQSALPWLGAGTVRLTIKLPTANWTSLRHAAFLSTNSKESAWDLSRSHYDLPPPGSRPESIESDVFTRRRAVCTNDYQNHPTSPRVFPDSQCHLSAPILTGRDRCYGILSVETTEPGVYDRTHVAATTLLAAYMAWALARARGRSAFRCAIDGFADTLRRIRSETTEMGLLDGFRDALQNLGYGRGLLSRVSYEPGGGFGVTGILVWGGEEMERVSELTRLDARRDSTHCQVQAVLTREVQVIRHPCHDARANRHTVKAGNVEPFAVFPLLDSHMRVIWTVQTARVDAAPIGAVDRRLLRELCARVMQSWEEQRRTQLERQWLEKMVQASFLDHETMLKWFADFVVHNGLVVRCRVFRIEEGGKQTPRYEGGNHKIPGFFDVRMTEDDNYILGAMKPILFVRSGGTTPLQAGEEFDVVRDMHECHPFDLDNNQRTQWVEAPVRVGGRVVAKLVLDHIGTPIDSFSLAEMRLISRFTRTLSIAAEVIEAQQVRSGLCSLGMHSSLLWHHLARAIDYLSYCPVDTDREELLRRQSATAKALSRFEGLFRKRRPGGKQPQTITVAEELNCAREVLEPLFDANGLGGLVFSFPSGDYSQPVPEANRPLLLILLSLVSNAAEAIRRARQQNSDHPAHITVEVQEDPVQLRVRVKDTGAGITPDNYPDLSDRLRHPARLLARQQGSGLVYSAMLAQECGWQLTLALPEKPTTFELIIPTGTRGGSR